MNKFHYVSIRELSSEGHSSRLSLEAYARGGGQDCLRQQEVGYRHGGPLDLSPLFLYFSPNPRLGYVTFFL